MNKNDTKKTVRKRTYAPGKEPKSFIVRHETELLPFLMEKLPQQNQRNVRRIIANHQVTVGGVPTSLFAYKLYPEDEVILYWDPVRKVQRSNLPIIYEDKELVVIDKPSGLLSVASDNEKSRTAYRMVGDYIAQKDRNARIFVVHRLDEDTSGVLIFAKNPEIRDALQNNWQRIVTKRGYFAIVENPDIPDEGHLENYLTQDDNHLVYVTKNPKFGKLSITDYKVLDRNRDYALLDVNISSGRKNQIRVQLGHIGHHVIGDDKYGEPSNPLKRLGLHAYELDFIHPITHKEYKFVVPMPKEFKAMFFGAKSMAKPTQKSGKEVKKDGLVRKKTAGTKRGSKGKHLVKHRH
ncbi:MAG: RluA family pseudouridine synthase [Bacilli bacterium]|nr:RluA family pseudouridine synthase [Bacilli bacterium]